MVILREKSGKNAQQSQVRGQNRGANRFCLLSPFSSLGNDFLEGCIENELMVVCQCQPWALERLGVRRE